MEKSGSGFIEIGAETNDHLFVVQSIGISGWIVGGLNGTLKEWDGNSWTHLDVTHSHINGIGVLKHNATILVTHAGDVIERTGGTWQFAQLQYRTTLHDVAVGPERDRGYACGANGTVLKRESAGDWCREPCPTDKTLFSIGVAENSATVVGASGTILRV